MENIMSNKQEKIKKELAELESKKRALLEELNVVENEKTERETAVATQKIAELVKVAETALEEAKKLATQYSISFSWVGPGYGMGGWFRSNEWQSSSSSC
jgi:NADH:ubiquinone oxidoreductase subunit E